MKIKTFALEDEGTDAVLRVEKGQLDWSLSGAGCGICRHRYRQIHAPGPWILRALLAPALSCCDDVLFLLLVAVMSSSRNRAICEDVEWLWAVSLGLLCDWLDPAKPVL